MVNLAVLLLGICSSTNAHTIFTTLFVDGKSQGDGTCIRLPHSDSKANSPVSPITGDGMACGRNGVDPVAFTCPSPQGAMLTFKFRALPTINDSEILDKSHMGPCSVYLKQVEDMNSDKAAGDGWFKIWEDGYDTKTKEWCTKRLIDNDGLMSVRLPISLPSGYYLVRPELLALHNAHKGSPEFYVGCAQVFIEDGLPGAELNVPANASVSIPGYVSKDTPGLKFNIWTQDPSSYIMPGPEVFIPTSPPPPTAESTSIGAKGADTVAGKPNGTVPDDCILKNANWCASPLSQYSSVKDCWASTKSCYQQGKECWGTAPATGGTNCQTWLKYCDEVSHSCEKQNTHGPPTFRGKKVEETIPAQKMWNDVFDTRDHQDSKESIYVDLSGVLSKINVPDNDLPSRETSSEHTSDDTVADDGEDDDDGGDDDEDDYDFDADAYGGEGDYDEDGSSNEYRDGEDEEDDDADKETMDSPRVTVTLSSTSSSHGATTSASAKDQPTVFVA